MKSLFWSRKGVFGSASEDDESRGSRRLSAKMLNAMESTKGRRETENGDEAMWQGREELSEREEKARWERRTEPWDRQLAAPLMALA